jgi:hypothetical protein
VRSVGSGEGQLGFVVRAASASSSKTGTSDARFMSPSNISEAESTRISWRHVGGSSRRRWCFVRPIMI